MWSMIISKLSDFGFFSNPRKDRLARNLATVSWVLICAILFGDLYV